MRNEKIIIKVAKIIVDDNNKVYKLSAKQVAYIIYATDGNGTQDRFITNSNLHSPQDWKSKFESAGFKNVNVKPFGFKSLITDKGGISGDLDIKEVDDKFFKNATNRPKINYSETPNRENPYSGSQNIPSDTRLSTPSYDDTNELQKFIFDLIGNNQGERIRAGWYGGSLLDWLNKLESDTEGEAIQKILELEFPYMNNSMLEKHLLDKQLSFEDFEPTKYQIRYFSIAMASLKYYITQPAEKFVNVPENKVKEKLKEIIALAQTFRKHKQYGNQEMSSYFDEHNKRLMDREDDTKDALMLMLKGMFR